MSPRTLFICKRHTKLNPSILATSKAIYNEALPVLYKDNIIRGSTQDSNDFSKTPTSSNMLDTSR
jgi:hypothetical protein